MNDIERQLTELFRQRAAQASVYDVLADVLDGTDTVAGAEIRPPRRGWSRVVAIAAAVLLIVALSAALLSRATDGTPTPGNGPEVRFPTTIPDAPTMPDDQTTAELRTIVVLSRDGFGTLFGTEPWPPSDRTITDFDVTSPAAAYIATCCNPGPSIWRDGIEYAPGVRIDYLLDGVFRAIVDPTTGTATVGDVVVDDVDALDVAIVDRTSALVLVGGPEPALLELTAADFAVGVVPRRATWQLPRVDGMCGLSSMQEVTLVLVGSTDAAGRCVTDRALALAQDDHHLIAALRFPASFVVVNSNHRNHLVGVTGDGRVLRGTLSSSSTAALTWVTLTPPGAAVAAAESQHSP